MNKRFDLLSALLLLLGVAAVVTAWWALLHAWGALMTLRTSPACPERKKPPAGWRPRRGQVSKAYRENISIIPRGCPVCKG